MQPWLKDLPRGPQPETCDLCGRLVPGAELRETDAEGLQGLMLCSSNPGCASFRTSLPASERRLRSVTSHIGQSRVFEPGGKLPWEES